MTLLLCILLIVALAAWWREKSRHESWIANLTTTLGLKHVESHLIPEAVAEAKAAADELPRERGLHEFFEAILNEIRQGVVIVDAELRILFANKPLTVLLERPTVQTGRTLIEELRDHQLDELVRAAIAGQKRVTRQVQLLINSSSASLGGRHFFIEAAPLTDSRVGAAWLMLQDVTETALTEQIRRDFIANASHELRTPLTIINGYIETLRDAPQMLPRCIATMEKHGRRLARLTEDMLSISKLEDTSVPLNRESFEVRHCAQDAIDHLTALTEGRDVRFVLDFPPSGSGHIHGDRFYWDQIFTNLIENSLKENPQPGLIITVKGQWSEDGACCISVADNGIGIPAHDLPFIFKRFFRGDKHHNSAIKGTGLGLSIVKRAVEAHGGKISATSKPGVETAFTITLPSTDNHPFTRMK